MICQNCQTPVDNDLIFCTNCGERIYSSKIDVKTAPIMDSVTAKASSNLKWIALIVALIAIPATLFGAYLLLNSSKKSPADLNAVKPNPTTPAPTSKTNAKQNANLDRVQKENNELWNGNSNQNTNPKPDFEEVEIINERIEIDPHSHYAKSFEIKTETAKIVGETEVLQGETFKGFVYLQSNYDEYFPDETYKMFSFGEDKKSVVDATLVKEYYVLIFVNESDKSIIIKSKISVKQP